MEFVGLIPAAGSGKRLYPFSRAIPKELYPLMGKPSIEHGIDCLKIGGIKKVFVIVGHQKGAIMDYLGNGEPYDTNISYLYQMKPKGLGHAILQAKDWIKKPFITLLGDSFIEPKHKIMDLIKKHEEKKPIATLLVQKIEDPASYGVVKFDSDGKITKLIEKPDPEEAKEYLSDGSYYSICGVYVFDPKIFEYIEKTRPGKRGEIWITDSIANAVKNGETAYAVQLDGDYMDIGKWKTVFEAKRKMMEKKSFEEFVADREAMVKKWD